VRTDTQTSSKLGGYPEVFKFYEDGKARRYNLLFAVNGGVLAVAKAVGDQGNHFLEGLTLRNVAIGLALFTIVMGIDIWAFGLGMREAGKDNGPDKWRGIFSWWGRGVLAAICALMIAAWLFVAFGATTAVVQG
jgi:hypothetical protein